MMMMINEIERTRISSDIRLMQDPIANGLGDNLISKRSWLNRWLRTTFI